MQCGAIRKNCLKHLPLPILQLIIPHVRSIALPFNTAFISCLLCSLLPQMPFPPLNHNTPSFPISTATEPVTLIKPIPGSWGTLQNQERIQHLLQLGLSRVEMPDTPAVRSGHSASHFAVICHIKKTSYVHRFGKGGCFHKKQNTASSEVEHRWLTGLRTLSNCSG